MEIPYTFNIPAAIVGDKVTAADKAMGAISCAYWVMAVSMIGSVLIGTAMVLFSLLLWWLQNR
jgi:hypothetical protein